MSFIVELISRKDRGQVEPAVHTVCKMVKSLRGLTSAGNFHTDDTTEQRMAHFLR